MLISEQELRPDIENLMNKQEEMLKAFSKEEQIFIRGRLAGYLITTMIRDLPTKDEVRITAVLNSLIRDIKKDISKNVGINL